MSISNFVVAALFSFSSPSLPLDISEQEVLVGEFTEYALTLNQTEPEAINLDQVKTMIQYPQLAKEDGIEGELPVKVLIDEKGSIILAKYPSQNAIHFKDAVEPHLADLRFKSATLDGHPAKAWTTLLFVFKLNV